MALRYLVWIAALLLAVAAAWHVRNTAFVRELLHPEQGRAKPIQFDNGTRREFPEEAPGKPAKAALPQGALRKCARGSQVIYTDVACPAGFTQGDVSGGTLNTVADPVRPPAKPASAAGRKSSLHEVLDVAPDDKLRERMLERAIEPRGN